MDAHCGQRQSGGFGPGKCTHRASGRSRVHSRRRCAQTSVSGWSVRCGGVEFRSTRTATAGRPGKDDGGNRTGVEARREGGARGFHLYRRVCDELAEVRRRGTAGAERVVVILDHCDFKFGNDTDVSGDWNKKRRRHECRRGTLKRTPHFYWLRGMVSEPVEFVLWSCTMTRIFWMEAARG